MKVENEKLSKNNDKELEENNESEIFVCRACGFMYDIYNPPKYLHPFHYYIASESPLKIKCPNCNKVVLYDTATKEEYKEYEERKAKKKEEKEKELAQKKRTRQIRLLKDDVEELLEDLKERLLNNEITPKRFVALFSHLATRIAKRYDKDLDIDWIDYKKTILDLSDGVLKVHEAQENSEEILEEYDENIEQDELYRAELEYYIEDNKYSIPDYELRQRIKEYDKQDAKIRSDEYKREIEEKYQNRRKALLQKAQEREKRQKLRDIM